MNLEQLRELLAAKIEKCDAIRAKAAAENRALTDEERREFDTLLAECQTTNADIARLEALERSRPPARQQDPPRPPARVEVHENREDDTFRSFGEQLIAIRNAAEDRGTMDPRLRRFDLTSSQVRAAAGLNEAVASDGGFLVMQDVSTELMRNSFESGQVANRTRKIPLSSNANGIKIPTIDETSRVDGSRWGGIQAYWVDEAATKTATKPKFGRIELTLKKLIGLLYATDELIEDASALEAVIREGFTEEFSFKLDDAVIRGTGAGMPLGILEAPALVSVAKETSQPADTIVFANVAKMWQRLLPRSKQNAVWFINADCSNQLLRMFVPHTNVAGTENVGGQSVYLPPGGLSGQQYGTLFGRPVIEIEQCATLGDKGDIILADLTQYLMITKGGIQTASSIHVKFITDETAFRFVLRTDGQPWMKSAITPYKGSNTLSAYVTLDARA